MSRKSGSEGGCALTGSPYPYPDPNGRFPLTNCLIEQYPGSRSSTEMQILLLIKDSSIAVCHLER